MKKLPIGIQSFGDLRREGYLYVDKTGYLLDLIRRGKVYFLSRPRRFGPTEVGVGGGRPSGVAAR
jgi:hypothetical protein